MNFDKKGPEIKHFSSPNAKFSLASGRATPQSLCILIYLD